VESCKNLCAVILGMPMCDLILYISLFDSVTFPN
jgi:hypothetical protein